MGPTQLRIDADSSAPHAWCRVRRKMDAWRGDAIIPDTSLLSAVRMRIAE